MVSKEKTLYFEIVRLKPSVHSWEKADLAPDFALGTSRIGGPIIDFAKGYFPPEGLYFVAMLDCSKIFPLDPFGYFPKTGYLYFFFNCFLKEPDCPQLGIVQYFDVSQKDLRRIIKEHKEWFWEGRVIDEIVAEKESLKERYDEDGEWDDFLGSEKTKIFGLLSDCQRHQEEILEFIDSDECVLLQVGHENRECEEGCLNVIIKKNDLLKKDFSKCHFNWSQS